MLTNDRDELDSASAVRNIPLTNAASNSFGDKWTVPLRRKLLMRMGFAAVMIVLAADCGPFILTLTAAPDVGTGLDESLGAVIPALVASGLALIGLYLIFRQHHLWLFRAIAVVGRSNIQILSILGTLTELRDEEAEGHTLRVSLYAVLFAEALHLPPGEIAAVAMGAFLHDVGKLIVPDCVLGKMPPLTSDERAVRRTHVRLGMEVVSRWPLLSEAAPVIGSHHEAYDGGGYPCGLRGEKIPREARIFALVDMFDSLTSPSFRHGQALTAEEALAVMAVQRGSRFDPALFDRFMGLASGFVREIPHSEVALINMLADRLCPYFGMVEYNG